MIRYLSGVTNRPLEQAVAGGLDVGLLVQPRNGYAAAIERFGTWAADNGAFTTAAGGFSPTAFEAMLADTRLLDARERCAFVAVPDVLTVEADGSVRGDAAATLEQFERWAPQIREAGYPAALVAQDGLDEIAGRIPWSSLDAVFLGASTEWKLGPGAAAITRAAKRRGKHVHMGRVNSLKRLRIAQSFGCDTADGTFLAYGPRTNLPRLQGWIRTLAEEEEAA